jgi:hypothetical protein
MQTQPLETVVQIQHANQKMPPTEGRPNQERWRMLLARIWVNRLKSNATLLELCKLDIGSTSINL